jgi:hypothetical protein
VSRYRTVGEAEFRAKVRALPKEMAAQYDCVTGPGRSGAVAAVYVSHWLGLPFLPWGSKVPVSLPRVLVVDTATWTGATIRKAMRKYGAGCVVFYVEGPGAMVRFWYEKRADQ